MIYGHLVPVCFPRVVSLSFLFSVFSASVIVVIPALAIAFTVSGGKSGYMKIKYFEALLKIRQTCFELYLSYIG